MLSNTSIVFKNEYASCSLEPLDDDTWLLINLLCHKDHLRQGHATDILKMVTAWADAGKQVVTLKAHQYGYARDGMSSKQLEDLYAKFDFIAMPDGSKVTRMVRLPRKIYNALNETEDSMSS